MNVLYIDHYAGSDSLGMEFRPYYMAREWKKHGINTTILAADFSHLRKKNPEVKKNLEVQNIDGVDFMFLKSIKYQGNGVKRILSMIEFVEKVKFYASKIVKETKPDVVIASSTYPMDTYAAQKIAKLSNAMLIHEIHDLWPLSPKVLGGYSDSHPFIKMMQKAEISAYKNSDYIVSILPNVEPYVRSLGINTEIVNVPNGLLHETIIQNVKGNDKVIKLIENLKKEGKYIVGYAGGISVSNAMESFVKSMEILKDNDDIASILIGEGINKKELEEYKKEKDIKNLHFVGSVNKSEIKETLSHMDALFMGAKDSVLYDYGISANKIFDYMMVGKPVIAAFNVKHSPLGYMGKYIPALDNEPKAIANAILESKKLTNEEREEIKIKSVNFIKEHHDYDKLALNFSDVFKREKKSKNK